MTEGEDPDPTTVCLSFVLRSVLRSVQVGLPTESSTPMVWPAHLHLGVEESALPSSSSVSVSHSGVCVALVEQEVTVICERP